ncbi:MAG: hypothetical protein EXS47_01475, partial [Candidatus Zambryskibacteria bacterium]|nr:hypothetical protein [Candidatus Zambryskibacteria bacterium]
LDVTGDIEYTGSITDVSDMRLKENISDFGNALSIITSLNAKSYNMIGSTRNEVGFLAQEVNEIFPGAVSIVDPVNGYMGVSYVSLIPVISEAVKELNLNIQGIAGIATSSAITTESFVSSFFSNLFSKITTWLADAGNGIQTIFAKEVHTDKLCVSNSLGETCVTREQLDSILGNVVSAGSQASSTPPVDTSLPVVTVSIVQGEALLIDTSLPSITILGDNPATITVGSVYSDMGATVTDTNADGSVNNNLGIYYNINGTDMAQVSIDTTASTSSPQATTTHTIIYSAVDGAGNTGTATRIVNVIE